jgi:hypothetical protein
MADPAPQRSRIDEKPRRQRYEKLFDALFSIRRSGWDSHWREVGDFMRPRRTRFWIGDKKGERRNQNIIDSTARFSSRTLSSGLHAGLTSPARPWMKLSTPDPELARFPPVKAWLHETTGRMLTIFAQTNLYNTLPTVYGDMGDFGTAAVSVLEDDKDLFRAYTYPLGSYAIGLSSRGLATTFCHEYSMTVRQLIEQFALEDDGRTIIWDKLSTEVKAMWDRGDYEEDIEVCWLVMPNEERADDRLGSQFLPWISCHWEKGRRSPDFLRVSGFRTFPLMVPRWDVTDSKTIYGDDCPGMTALGDVKQLQIEQRRKGQAINKIVDPPLVGPPSLRTQKTSLLPGDVTYQDVREGMQGLKTIHDIHHGAVQVMTEDIREVQYRIQRAYYEDLFLMLATSDQRLGADRPTAREIDERHEEKLLALGPVLERTNDELLDPLIDRVYALMEANGLIPEPPEEVNGVTLKVEYISIMAQAQKLVGVVGQDRFIQSILPIALQVPEVLDKVDWYQTVDNYGDMLGIDPLMIRPTEEAKELSQQRAQAANAAMQAAAAKDEASAMKSASETQLGGDTALAQLSRGLGTPAAGAGVTM